MQDSNVPWYRKWEQVSYQTLWCFDTLKEAQTIIEDWRLHYNHIRPHSALGYKLPAPMAMLCATAHSAALHAPQHRAIQHYMEAKSLTYNWIKKWGLTTPERIPYHLRDEDYPLGEILSEAKRLVDQIERALHCN